MRLPRLINYSLDPRVTSNTPLRNIGTTRSTAPELVQMRVYIIDVIKADIKVPLITMSLPNTMAALLKFVDATGNETVDFWLRISDDGRDSDEGEEKGGGDAHCGGSKGDDPRRRAIRERGEDGRSAGL